MRIALVSSYKLPLAGFVWVLGVVGTVCDCLGYRFAPIPMDGEQPGSGDKSINLLCIKIARGFLRAGGHVYYYFLRFYIAFIASLRLSSLPSSHTAIIGSP